MAVRMWAGRRPILPAAGCGEGSSLAGVPAASLPRLASAPPGLCLGGGGHKPWCRAVTRAGLCSPRPALGERPPVQGLVPGRNKSV